MKMKYIGGLANGRIVDVESYYKEHDQIRVPARIEFEILTFIENIKAITDPLPNPYYYYKIATLHFQNKEKLNFLIPIDMDVKNALCFVLGA